MAWIHAKGHGRMGKQTCGWIKWQMADFGVAVAGFLVRARPMNGCGQSITRESEVNIFFIGSMTAVVHGSSMSSQVLNASLGKFQCQLAGNHPELSGPESTNCMLCLSCVICDRSFAERSLYVSSGRHTCMHARQRTTPNLEHQFEQTAISVSSQLKGSFNIGGFRACSPVNRGETRAVIGCMAHHRLARGRSIPSRSQVTATPPSSALLPPSAPGTETHVASVW